MRLSARFHWTDSQVINGAAELDEGNAVTVPLSLKACKRRHQQPEQGRLVGGLFVDVDGCRVFSRIARRLKAQAQSKPFMPYTAALRRLRGALAGQAASRSGVVADARTLLAQVFET
jgi:hypothetical protein